MSAAGLSVERIGTAVVITLDRPEAKNAISRALMGALVETVEQASADPEARAVILASTGDVFAAGGDLREFEQLRQASGGVDQVLGMGRSLQSFERCDVPVIAAMQGAAFGGGCELMLACDLVVMETQAVLAFRQASMGLSCAWGGSVRLMERVGPMRASQILLTGQPVSAHQALEWHLINAEVPHGMARPYALQWAHEIAQHPRAAIAAAKHGLLQVRQAWRGNALEGEARVFSSLWDGADHRAAMAAFLHRSK